MKYKLILFGLLLFISGILHSQVLTGVKIGSTVINLETVEYQTDSLLFINLHNDEVTSIKAVKKYFLNIFGNTWAYKVEVPARLVL
jgi:hypothetical protein